MSDFKTFHLGDVALQSGAVLPSAWLTYKTYGALNAARDNVIVLPTFYTGTHGRNEGFFGPGRAMDPERHFIVSVDMFGNGYSSSPSNMPRPHDGPRFPNITLHDNIACQHRLLTEELGVAHIALVAGWSMAGSQSYQWAAQYPDMVGAIVPFCASARTSPHNIVFLEGVKAALTADGDWNGGDYDTPPERGLRAFGRVYAGWAFSQTFYGMTAIKLLARKLWKINRPGRHGSGIVFLMMFVSASLILRWMCRNCLPESWPCASQTQKNTLSQRLPSIGCSNPLI